jgi:hypothetical protein
MTYFSKDLIEQIFGAVECGKEKELFAALRNMTDRYKLKSFESIVKYKQQLDREHTQWDIDFLQVVHDLAYTKMNISMFKHRFPGDKDHHKLKEYETEKKTLERKKKMLVVEKQPI